MSFVPAALPQRWPKILLIVGAALAGASGTLASLDPRIGYLLLAGVASVTALFLFFHPRIALLALVGIAFTRFWWTEELHLLPKALRFADVPLLGLLAARILADRLRAGRLIERTPWDLLFLLYFGSGIVSATVNQVPLVNALAGLRGPVFYGLVFFVIVNGREHFDPDYLTWIWKLLVVFASLQVLTGIYQYPARSLGADSLTGTLGPGGANDLGIFVMPFLVWLVSKRIDEGDRSRLGLLGIVSMSAALILCSSRAAWFIVLATALILWGRLLRNPRVLATTLISGLVIFFITTRVMLAQEIPSISEALGAKSLYAAVFLISSGGGALAYYPVVWRLVLAHAPIPIFGLGPGMVSSTAAVALDAHLYRNVLYNYFGQTYMGFDGGVESQVLATGGEFGPIGFFAILFVFIGWAVMALRTYRRSDSGTDRPLAAGVLSIAIAMIVLTPIRNIWETPHLAFLMWLSGSILYARLGERGRRAAA